MSPAGTRAKSKLPSATTILKKLSLLMEINRAVSRNLNLSESLRTILKILRQSYAMPAGAIYLSAADNKSIQLAAALGFRQTAKNHPSLQPGEGLIGRIIETGQPVIIPRISQADNLPTPALGLPDADMPELSFIGLPIALDYKTFGALATYLNYQAQRHFETTLKFLTLVASALLQPIRVADVIASERQQLKDENVMLKHRLQEEYSFHNIIGNSHEMRDVYEQVAQVAQTDTTVLLRGESGTGKELIAEAIHYNSARSEQPFIRVNCAAIPENLIESEFFGYEKGAFTGAVTARKGRFELADQGTIFLDEIGDLSPLTQIKLLRVLQEKTFERVGGTETIKVNVRVIAATNINLEDQIARGNFRDDLYYRLNVFPIYLPPLRDRKTDILLLADHFMLKYSRKHHRPVKRISTPAIDMLMRYHWPGNVRELENCIERSVLVCEDQVIHSYHLPPTLQTAESSDTTPQLSLREAVNSYEKELIQDALKTTNGNKAQAARLLDTTERILGYKVHKYQIDVNRFKP